MNEQTQADLLAAWIDGDAPNTPELPAEDALDSDVVEAIVALRPELAPAARVTADDILAAVTSGPLAAPMPMNASLGATSTVPVASNRGWFLALLGAGGLSTAIAAAALLLTVSVMYDSPLETNRNQVALQEEPAKDVDDAVVTVDTGSARQNAAEIEKAPEQKLQASRRLQSTVRARRPAPKMKAANREPSDTLQLIPEMAIGASSPSPAPSRPAALAPAPPPMDMDAMEMDVAPEPLIEQEEELAEDEGRSRRSAKKETANELSLKGDEDREMPASEAPAAARSEVALTRGSAAAAPAPVSANRARRGTSGTTSPAILAATSALAAGDPRGAIRSCTDALASLTGNTRERQLLYALLGDAHTAIGELAAADAAYQQADAIRRGR